MSKSCRAQITSLFKLTKPRIRIEYCLGTHLLVRLHVLECRVTIDFPPHALLFPDPLGTKARFAPAAQEAKVNSCGFIYMQRRLQQATSFDTLTKLLGRGVFPLENYYPTHPLFGARISLIPLFIPLIG